MSKKGEHSGAKQVQPPKPKISFLDLLFIINVETKAKNIALATPSRELKLVSNDRFHVQIEHLSDLGFFKSDMNDVKINCEVVSMGDSDDSVKIFEARRSLDKNSRWLINDLLAPQGLIRSGLVADIKLSFNGDLLDKIGFEICTEQDRRYYSVDDTLRYLQCFFDDVTKKRRYLCFFP
ncbi:unnamed protein product [Arabis nemorensis]|uniref:Uncharacterized protein n=1 Tax=Arabis nemorensis TaxID=586526 RepID=A0A565CHS7_9BRAS|nr:unnamed protein product [Arabis nemorensis]